MQEIPVHDPQSLYKGHLALSPMLLSAAFSVLRGDDYF